MKNLRKAVLASITPKYCELIVSGQKTVELRKTRPKIDTSFKVYMYCTKPKRTAYYSAVGLSTDELYRLPNGEIKYGCSIELAGWDNYTSDNFLNGKVIGEFVCDRIFDARDIGGKEFHAKACMTTEEWLKYTDGHKGIVWCWNISDPKIYDEPKKLSEFLKYNRTEDDCYFQHLPKPRSCRDCIKKCGLKRPPQSWCYVEDLEV